MKLDVEYSLDSNVRSEIIKVKELCRILLDSFEVFLFGSIAKGKYKKDSDIDLLILIPEHRTLKELRYLRHLLEDEIDKLNINRNVDIKLYNKERYLELSKEVSFEQAIKEDLIDIMRW